MLPGRVPANTCQASADVAVKLRTMETVSPKRYSRHRPTCRYCNTVLMAKLLKKSRREPKIAYGMAGGDPSVVGLQG